MSFLEVPGAKLRYDVVGEGRLIVFVAGARGEGIGFLPIAQRLSSQYKVVTYDRRGYGGSALDGPQDYDNRLATDAADVAHLVRREGDGPAIVFGSSSGAIVALQVLSDHADLVRTLLAHEPPAARRLPPAEGEALIASNYKMYDTYRRSGIQAAMGPFMMEVLSDTDRRMIAQSATRPDPAGARNFDYWFEHELRQYPATVFDDMKLNAVSGKLSFLGGQETAALYPHRIAALFASQLNTAFELVPGGHLGFTTSSEPFAARLVEILDKSADRSPPARV